MPIRANLGTPAARSASFLADGTPPRFPESKQVATALGAFGYLKFLVRFSTPPVRKKLSMAKLNIKQKLARAIGKHHFSRKHILQILIWPMVCLGVAGLLWGVVISKLNSDREFLEKHTLSQVAALSRAVAKCLSLPLLKMDELSRSLQFQWEHEREIVTRPFPAAGLEFRWHCGPPWPVGAGQPIRQKTRFLRSGIFPIPPNQSDS